MRPGCSFLGKTFLTVGAEMPIKARLLDAISSGLISCTPGRNLAGPGADAVDWKAAALVAAARLRGPDVVSYLAANYADIVGAAKPYSAVVLLAARWSDAGFPPDWITSFNSVIFNLRGDQKLIDSLGIPSSTATIADWQAFAVRTHTDAQKIRGRPVAQWPER
jgi:hypothetical protein